jgi:hypothetical protein
MNWRRGLVLAGINLAVAIPMIMNLETKDAQSLRMREQAQREADREAAARPSEPTKTNVIRSGERTVSFHPCLMTVHYPVEVVVEQASTYPSLVFTGWRMVCPPKWSLAARLHTDVEWVPTIDSEITLNAARKKLDPIFLIVQFAQWLLVGSFPLVAPRQWWAEPGVLITLCTVIAGGLALLPMIEGMAQLPALIAMITWILWFGLLLWKPVHTAWSSTLHGLRRLSN